MSPPSTRKRGPSAPPDPDLRAFLPMTRSEMEARGWDEVDVVFASAQEIRITG